MNDTFARSNCVHSSAPPGNGISEFGCDLGGDAGVSAREVRSARAAVDEDMQSVCEVLQARRGRPCLCCPGLPLRGHCFLHVRIQPLSLVWQSQRQQEQQRHRELVNRDACTGVNPSVIPFV